MSFIRLTEMSSLSLSQALVIFISILFEFACISPLLFSYTITINKKTAGLGPAGIRTLIHVPVDPGKKPMQVLNFIMINPWHPLITRLYLPIR